MCNLRCVNKWLGFPAYLLGLCLGVVVLATWCLMGLIAGRSERYCDVLCETR